MKTRTRRRCLHELLALGGAAALAGCATIIHPERKGNPPGRIDVAPLILDILWFIPGLIPGVIALVVDFGTGAIFLTPGTTTRRGPKSLAIVRGERITVRPPEIPMLEEEDLAVRLQLVGARGTAIAQAHGRWGSTRRDPLQVELDSECAYDLGEGRLELRARRDGATVTAMHPLRLGIV